MSFFNAINFYGLGFPLRYRSYKIVNSSIGFFFSILSIVFFLCLFFQIFIEEDFIFFTYYKENKPSNKINLKNTFMIGLVDNNGIPYHLNNNYINFEMNLISIKHISGSDNYVSNIIKNETKIDLKSCDNFNDIHNSFHYEKYLCSKEDIFINGMYGDNLNEYKYINIEVKKCNQSINDECINDIKDLDLFFQNKFFSLNYIDNVPLPEYNDLPIQQFHYSNLIPFSNLYSQKYIYHFILSKYFIYKKFQKKKYSFVQYHNYINIKDDYSNNLLEIIFTLSKFQKIYKKKFQSILDSINKFGGCVYFFTLIFQYITKYFNKKSFITDIINNLILTDYKKQLTFTHNCLKSINYQQNSFSIGKSNNPQISQISGIEALSVEKKNISKISRTQKSPKMPRLSLPQISKKNSQIKNQSIYQYIHQFNGTKEEFNFSFCYYLLPFCLIKKKHKFQTFEIYDQIYKSYMSIDVIVPYIEKIRKIFRQIVEKLEIKLDVEIFKIK